MTIASLDRGGPGNIGMRAIEASVREWQGERRGDNRLGYCKQERIPRILESLGNPEVENNQGKKPGPEFSRKVAEASPPQTWAATVRGQRPFGFCLCR